MSMGDYAASGGYYISMGADAIVAGPGTITGSIGVFSGKFSLRGLYGKLGMSQETVRRGRNATLFSSSEPWSEEERAKVRGPEPGLLRDLRRQGGGGAAARPRPRSRPWRRGASGRGARRCEAGLVDSLGGSTPRCAVARDKARIAKGQEVQLVVMPQRKGLLETLLERQEEDVLDSGAGAARRGRSCAGRRSLCDRGPIARLPFDLGVR